MPNNSALPTTIHIISTHHSWDSVIRYPNPSNSMQVGGLKHDDRGFAKVGNDRGPCLCASRIELNVRDM